VIIIDLLYFIFRKGCMSYNYNLQKNYFPDVLNTVLLPLVAVDLKNY